VFVNGIEIAETAIAQEAQFHEAASGPEARAAAARALAIRELLLQRARALGLMASPLDDGEGRRETDEEALIRQVLEQELVAQEPTEEECRRVFESSARRLGPTVPFDLAAPRIRDALRARAWTAAAARYVEALARAATIEGLALSMTDRARS
jgi:hypothetical protein